MKRFILLNNNRIIDNKKYNIVRGNRSYGKINLVKNIIKEADSKFDLLEKGDLIEFKSTWSGKNFIQIFEKQEDEKYYFGDNSYCTKNPIVEFEKDPLNPSLDKPDLMIIKIYKPNNNKGYDLAWEREEE